MKNKSVNMPDDLEQLIDKSRANMLKKRGKVPTFTDWILEAAAEKIEREKRNEKYNL